MTRAEMLAELKLVLRESTYDAAWGDALLLTYLSEGQDKFCEDTGFFLDDSTYTITTANGVANYVLPPRVLSVVDVWDGSARLGKFQETERFLLAAGFTPPAGASAWQLDRRTGYLTIYPTPSTTKTLTLRVWRYAMASLNSAVTATGTAQAGTTNTITLASGASSVDNYYTGLTVKCTNNIPAGVQNLGGIIIDYDGSTKVATVQYPFSVAPTSSTTYSISAEPEIPERFHRAPVHWAAYRALMHHDMEQQDGIKAQDHLAAYQTIAEDGRHVFETPRELIMRKPSAAVKALSRGYEPRPTGGRPTGL